MMEYKDNDFGNLIKSTEIRIKSMRKHWSGVFAR